MGFINSIEDLKYRLGRRHSHIRDGETVKNGINSRSVIQPSDNRTVVNEGLSAHPQLIGFLQIHEYRDATLENRIQFSFCNPLIGISWIGSREKLIGNPP